MGGLKSLGVAFLNLECRRNVAALGQVVEQCAVFAFELVVVGLQKNHSAVVERFHVLPQESLGYLVVERGSLEVSLGEQEADHASDLAAVIIRQLHRMAKRGADEYCGTECGDEII